VNKLRRWTAEEIATKKKYKIERIVELHQRWLDAVFNHPKFQEFDLYYLDEVRKSYEDVIRQDLDEHGGRLAMSYKEVNKAIDDAIANDLEECVDAAIEALRLDEITS
jgi:hypothetical protein